LAIGIQKGDMFGERLRAARVSANLSQERLAELLSVDRQAVIRWEKNRRLPRGPKLAEIAGALSKPVSWFFEEDSEAAEVAPQSLPEAQTQEEPSVRPTPNEEDRLDRIERILGTLVEQQARAAPEERLAQAVAQAMKQALEPLHDVMASLAHGHMGTQAELARMQGKLREMEADLREMDEEDEEGDCPGQEACSG